VQTSLAAASRPGQDAFIMRQPIIHYVESSLPEYMTISDYRRSRPRRAPKRGLRGVVVFRPRFA